MICLEFYQHLIEIQNNTMIDIKEIYKYTFYGFVIGDILGLPVEARSRDYLKQNPVNDMISNELRKTRVGYWSDDTSMCLCTMESINECNSINYANMMDKFIMWASRGYLTVDDRKFFGVGERTLQALKFYYNEKTNPTISINQEDGKWILEIGKLSTQVGKEKISGNGSLMRMLPIIFYLYNKKLTIKEKINIICDSSSITHYSEDCKASCILYMFIIYNLLEKKEKEESIKNSLIELKNNYDLDKCEGINRFYEDNLFTKDINDLKTSGYVIDTIETVICLFLKTNSYKEAVLSAVNLGGDTDTIAALTGALCAIYYGSNDIPKIWIDKILKKDVIDNIIEDFIKKI